MMQTHRLRSLAIATLFFASFVNFFGARAQAAAGDVPPDAKVVSFINEFFTKMEEAGSATVVANAADIDTKVAAAGKLAAPYFHKSNLAKTGDNLNADRLRFSFKKGFSNLKLYKHPVNVSRVRKLTTQAIGFKETAEKGTSFDYFIDKKEGAAGRPAQIRIFINEAGVIKIDDVGSL